MRARSLRLELLLWLVGPLAALVLLNVLTSYREALSTANLITDRTLLASARVIAEQIHEVDGHVEALIPPSALAMFESPERDRVAYSVHSAAGSLLAGYPDLPGPPRAGDTPDPVTYETVFRVEPVRAVAITQPVIASQPTGNALVVVAETLRSRDQLVASLWKKALRDEILLVIAAALFAGFGLSRALAPILRLRDDIVRRDPGSLREIPPGSVQTELRPLVAALNAAFVRLDRLIESQRHFIANAAHQLRTPLTVLKTQAQVGLRDAERAGKDEALAGIHGAVDGMTRIVNQLLLLARAEHEGEAESGTRADLVAVARHALGRFATRAIDRSVDLALDTKADSLPVLGSEELLREMLANLVDNALRHVPAGGAVTVHLARAEDFICVRVEDNGPGIPAGQRARVFQRFHHAGNAGGAGLGLAIVQEIATGFGGSVALHDGAGGSGLAVEVRLRPATDRPPGASEDAAP